MTDFGENLFGKQAALSASGKTSGTLTARMLPTLCARIFWRTAMIMQCSESMTLGNRLRTLRRDLGLSQEAIGAQGFVSTPGWIKIENGQRLASEKLIDAVAKWLVSDKYMRPGAANALQEELLILKYLNVRSPFVREMAKARAKNLPDGGASLLAADPVLPGARRRGRPSVSKASGKDVALVAENSGAYKVKRRKS